MYTGFDSAVRYMNLTTYTNLLSSFIAPYTDKMDVKKKIK